MKIKIGKYVDWLGPYQIVDRVFFWLEQYPDDGLEERPIYKLRNWVYEHVISDDRTKRKNEGWFQGFCQWINDHKHRKVKIKIDDYDVWNANHTIALIVLPMLKRLKELKQGSPLVDLGDVPEELWPLQLSGPNNNYTDDTVHKRWEWVMNELIWTFEQIVDDDSESQFYDHSESSDPNDDLMTQVGKLKIDREGLAAWQERKDNGLRWFGKYYQGLWD